MATDNTSIKTTTPAGIAQFPWITEPDTRFNPDGDYKVALVFPEEVAAELTARINKVWEAFSATLKGPKGKKAPASLGYEKEYDDDGNETGNIIVKAKTKAKITKKDGTVISKKVPIYDAKGQPFEPDALWGGTKLKANITIQGYDAGGNVGVAIKLNAVQVIELRAGGGNASSYGFGEEEGYTADTFVNKGTTDGANNDNGDEEDDF